MPFITQGKTNLKYILIVVVLAALVAVTTIFLINWRFIDLQNNLPWGKTENQPNKKAILPTDTYGLSCAENSATHKIYCFGGSYEEDGFPHPTTKGIEEIREYDPAIDSLSIKKATLPLKWSGEAGGINGLSCVENSATNKIYCFGGYGQAGVSGRQILEYDPTLDILSTKGAILPEMIRYSCVESSATHKIYCFGDANSIVEYDPATDIMSIKEIVFSFGEILGLSCVENSGNSKIYCFGDLIPGSQKIAIKEYDPVNDSLLTKNANLPGRRYGFSCVENSATHKIYCFGGDTNAGYTDQILEYEPESDTLLIKTTTLPSERASLSCVENSATNKIYCFGGWPQKDVVRQIFEYTPSDN